MLTTARVSTTAGGRYQQQGCQQQQRLHERKRKQKHWEQQQEHKLHKGPSAFAGRIGRGGPTQHNSRDENHRENSINSRSARKSRTP
jgi:hypothetical protein